MLKRHLSLWLGGAIVALLLAASLLAPLLAGADPLASDLGARLKPPGGGHPLGTDALGRDLWARLLYGSRFTLGAALAVTAASFAIGSLVGMLAGYYGGPLDNALMRLVDLIKAFPARILALVLVGVLGPGLINLCLAMILTAWVAFARIVRSVTLSVRSRDFVLAAQACGRSGGGIIRRHIFPNTFPQIAVLLALEAGWIVMAISGFSLLGLGAQPPAPEWGTMVSEARSYFRSYPYLLFFPSLAVMLAITGFTLLGEGLRDWLDPQERS